MTTPVTGAPQGGAFVSGLGAKQMLVFETLADDYMIEVLTQVADAYADMLEAAATVVTAAADDAAAAGAGAVDPAIFAGVPAAVSQSLATSMIPLVAEVYQSSQSAVRADMIRELNTTLPPVHSLDAAAYLRRAPKVFDDIGDQLQANIRKGLAEGFEAGESIPQLAQRVRAAAGVTSRKATLVARTSVIAAANNGSIDMAKSSGIEMQKEWLATVPTDGRTRPTHIAADGQRVDLHGKFIVGGFECDHPGEYTLPDAEKLGCRCTQGYVIPRAQVMETTEGQAQTEARLRELRAQREARQQGLGGQTRTTVTGIDPNLITPQAPVSRALNQEFWGTASDPAMKMTVTQLRDVLKNEGITAVSKAAKKQDMVAGIRQWEVGNARSVLPPMPTDLAAPAVTTTTRIGQFTARWDNPDPGRLTGSLSPGTAWDGGLPSWVDTGPAGIEVRNLEITAGYVVKYGRAWRIDGTAYLIETPWETIGVAEQAQVLRILGELRQLHADIPAAEKYNRRYAWLLDRNPSDAHWERVYRIPGFRSAASAGHGEVNIWDERLSGSPSVEDIRHETGHNVDQEYASRRQPTRGSKSKAWEDAVADDAAADATGKIKDFKPIREGTGHPIASTPADQSKPYPNGVTDYGRADEVEDFAESYANYLRGPVATGELPGRPGVSDIYFRDLYPARAKIMDDLFPDFAKAQQAEIKAARAAKAAPDRTALKGEARARAADIEAADNATVVLSDVDELVSKRADVGVIEARLQEGIASKSLSKVEADVIRKAVATGDRAKVDAALAKVGKKRGVAYRHAAGDLTTMVDVDVPGAEAMRSVSGQTIAPGAQVRVVRRGATLTRNGETITLEPTIVREVTPDELAGMRQAVVDERTNIASAVAQLRAELDRGPVSGARVGQIADRNNLPIPVRQALVKASATPDGLKRAVAAQMKAAEVKASGVVNRGVDFDPDTMEVRGAAALEPGTKVKVVETGYVTEIDGVPVVLRRAIVEPVAPKTPAKVPATATKGTISQGELSIEKALNHVDDLETMVDRQVGVGASAKATTAKVRAHMRAIRLQPIDAAGNDLTGTSAARAVRYEWRTPGRTLRLDQPAPADFTPIQVREFEIAQRLSRMALAVEDAQLSGADVVAAVRAAKSGESTTTTVAKTGQAALDALPIRDTATLEAATTHLVEAYPGGYMVETPIDIDGISGLQVSEAVGDYSDQGYQYVNAALRQAKGDLDAIPAEFPDGAQGIPGHYSERRVRRMIEGIDAAMSVSRTTDPITVYRGLRSDRSLFGDIGRPGSLVGREFVDHGYTSTSVREATARTFASNGAGLKLDIYVPRGTGALGIENTQAGLRSEAEILLARGLRYRVVADRKVAGVRTLDVEIVPSIGETVAEAVMPEFTIAQRIDDIVSTVAAKAPRNSRAAVKAELTRQADLVPGAVRELQGVRIATPEEWRDIRPGDTDHAWAAYVTSGKYPGQILLHPRWADPAERKILEGTIRRSYDDPNGIGWSFPGYDGGPSLDVISGILRHEFGHHVSKKWPLTVSGHTWGPVARRQLLVPLADELGVAPMPEGGDFVDWFNRSEVQRAIRSKVSGYAADGPDELLAEIWSIYSGRGDEASKLAKRIGKIMADAWGQDVATTTTAVRAVDKAADAARALLATTHRPTAAQLKKAGMSKIATPSKTKTVPYDPDAYDLDVGVPPPAAGAPVRIVEPGYSVTVDGETVIIRKPVVEVVESKAKAVGGDFGPFNVDDPGAIPTVAQLDRAASLTTSDLEREARRSPFGNTKAFENVRADGVDIGNYTVDNDGHIYLDGGYYSSEAGSSRRWPTGLSGRVMPDGSTVDDALQALIVAYQKFLASRSPAGQAREVAAKLKTLVPSFKAFKGDATREIKRLRDDIQASLARQAELAPKSFSSLEGVEFADAGTGAGRDLVNAGAEAVYNQFSNKILLAPKWYQDIYRTLAANLEGVRHRFNVPTGFDAAGSTVAHEFGHHLESRLRRLGLWDQDDGGQVFLRELEGYLGLPSRAFGRDGDFETIESVMHRNATAIHNGISGYANENFQELVAEVWAEYSSLGTAARPGIWRLGEILRRLSETGSVSLDDIVEPAAVKAMRAKIAKKAAKGAKQ